ncbi:DUF192 domain-containing protein [Antarctobacter jejuensis]|uniref:DUF192 domain-containing protein n=1 Tax=Antarctobacter jejuensis TaxID=1439938 RepID=UPI003FD0EAAD
MPTTIPPTAAAPSATPGATPPAASAPVIGPPAAQAPVAKAPTDQPDPVTEPPVKEPPVIAPILPIGDEVIPDTEPQKDVLADPDNTIGACRDDTIFVRGLFGKARFSVDVAKTADERAQGLMNVKNMPTSKGMLFVYPVPQPVAFWMKNTLIPLDMIFADSRGVVVKVHDSAVPGDETSIPGGDDVQYVLEINGGLARMLGIREGSELRHPEIRRAAWPC